MEPVRSSYECPKNEVILFYYFIKRTLLLSLSKLLSNCVIKQTVCGCNGRVKGRTIWD